MRHGTSTEDYKPKNNAVLCSSFDKHVDLRELSKLLQSVGWGILLRAFFTDHVSGKVMRSVVFVRPYDSVLSIKPSDLRP